MAGGCCFGYYLAARGFAAAAVLALGRACGAGAGAAGMSPIKPLTGQILKMGHFLQPTAMAIGQRVMAIPVENNFNKSVCAPYSPESSL